MNQRISYLLERWIDQTISADEQQEWDGLLTAAQNDESIKEALDQVWKRLPQAYQLRPEKADTIFRTITGAAGSAPRVVPMHKRKVFRWVAAASVLLAASLLFILTRSGNDVGDSPEIAQTQDIQAPNATKAVITLADGRRIYIDSAADGLLAAQNSVNVLKNDQGEIVYQSAINDGKAIVEYNTLYNPRGSKVISLKLADGTKVWLNSESSLRYPTAFNGSTREVEMTGEAYFEVAHNASQPFHLKKGEVDVTVLGTHFNVNAYEDEGAVRVTLLEGAVRVSTFRETQGNKTTNPVTIKPGEQVSAAGGVLSAVIRPDLDEVMAWKAGQFNFSRQDIRSIMRQVARWYNVQVSYEGNVSNETFSGIVSRDTNVSQVLKIMEQAGVKFKIEGRRLVVMK